MSIDDRDMAPGRDDHDAWFDEVAAYVVGGLTPDEESLLLEHAADCSRCTSRIQWLRPAADLLPASVEQLTPSAGLRDRIMAEVHADLAAQPELAERPAAPAVPAPRPASTERRVSPGDRISGWFGGLTASPALGLAAALLVVVALGGGYLLGDDGSDPEPEPVTAVAQSQSAAATVSRVGDSGTINVEQLPRTGRKEDYQVWVMRDGNPEPSTVIDYQGRPVSAAITGSLEGADQIVVTREPAGGSQSPRGPQILTADLD